MSLLNGTMIFTRLNFIYFECELRNKEVEFRGTNPDNNQVGVEWIRFDQLSEIRIYPKKIAERIMNKQAKPFYIGDSN